jgi:hypothetical protein
MAGRDAERYPGRGPAPGLAPGRPPAVQRCSHAQAALMAVPLSCPPPRVTAVRRDIAMAPIVRRPRGPHTPVRTSTTAQASTTTAASGTPQFRQT